MVAALVAVFAPVPMVLGLLALQDRFFSGCGRDAGCHRETDIPINIDAAGFTLLMTMIVFVVIVLPMWFVLHRQGRVGLRTALVAGAVIGGGLGLVIGGGLMAWPITGAEAICGAMIGWAVCRVAYGRPGRPDLPA